MAYPHGYYSATAPEVTEVAMYKVFPLTWNPIKKTIKAIRLEPIRTLLFHLARSHSQSLKICIVLAVFQEEDKLQELLETNPPIAVDIRLLDNLVRLFVAQLGRGVDLRRRSSGLFTDRLIY